MEAILAGKQLNFWIRASRSAALGQSLTPYLLGAIMATGTLFYNHASATEVLLGLGLSVLGFFGVALAHSGLNLFDDYFDMKKGAVQRREEMADGGMRARMGKCVYLKGGDVTLADTRRVAILFIALALILGLIVLVLRGWPILVFAGIALVLGLLYAGPPLRLSYHGLGELMVGLIFGPLVVNAAYFVACGRIDALSIYVSIPIGLLVANILNTHAIMDFGPDKAADRVTLSVALGSQKAGYVASVVLVAASYLVVIVGVALRWLPIAALVVVVTLPLTIFYLRHLWDYVTGKGDEFVYRPWMGPFNNQERIKATGIMWFMSRWLLSRNLVMMVSVLLAVASLTPWYL
ncbi:MAG: prenyltransferase [Coriobacteriales bacterium]|jgi:1,4-dihydroxy-2-naphthoate octaprenyltransferase|nr:prenyltransferase [Coriobacteriales bacterium]